MIPRDDIQRQIGTLTQA